MAKKPDSFTIQLFDGEVFTVRVGDKVIAIRGGKLPRIEFLESLLQAAAEGKTGFGGYRVEPYDESNEARHAAVEANHTAMTQAVSQIRRMTDDEWQRLCIDPVRREALLKLLSSA